MSPDLETTISEISLITPFGNIIPYEDTALEDVTKQVSNYTYIYFT